MWTRDGVVRAGFSFQVLIQLEIHLNLSLLSRVPSDEHPK